MTIKIQQNKRICLAGEDRLASRVPMLISYYYCLLRGRLVVER